MHCLMFLHEEYGCPGTLLNEPFTEMTTVALDEKYLLGAPLGARAWLKIQSIRMG